MPNMFPSCNSVSIMPKDSDSSSGKFNKSMKTLTLASLVALGACASIVKVMNGSAVENLVPHDTASKSAASRVLRFTAPDDLNFGDLKLKGSSPLLKQAPEERMLGKSSSSDGDKTLTVKQRLEQLEKEVQDLEKLTSSLPDAHPSQTDPNALITCDVAESRINNLGQQLGAGCLLDNVPNSTRHRVVCKDPGLYDLHLPDMCNATIILIAGGGAGGTGAEKGPNLVLAGGGGAGGVVIQNDTDFADGLYSLSVGAGGRSNYLNTGGIGGDTFFQLKLQKSNIATSFPEGTELRALGGGRGGGVPQLTIPPFTCTSATSGGSGGGGSPSNFVGCFTSGGGGLQGNSGGDGSEVCPGGGGGAGAPGSDGDAAATSLDDCKVGTGGEGIYLGNIVGEDYGSPGGWFAGGGHPSFSFRNRTLGGGGSFGPVTKNGAEGTGSGGFGCEGNSNDEKRVPASCNYEYVGTTNGGTQVLNKWGGNGGSGIFFIVFDTCPCNNTSTNGGSNPANIDGNMFG